MLEPFGIAQESEQLYLTLLEFPGADIGELSDRLGWGRARTLAELTTLGDLALLRHSRDHPGTLRAVAPDVGLERLLARGQAELAARRLQLEEGRAALRTLTEEYAQRCAPSSAPVERLTGADSVHDRLVQLSRETEEQVLALVPGGPLATESVVAGRAADYDVLSRGVRMRSIHLDSIRGDRAGSAHLRWLADTGAEIRTVPVLPPRIVIFDRAKAVLPLGPGEPCAAVLLCDPGAVAAIAALFDQIWRTAAPFGAPPRGRTREPTDTEKALLQLLQEGCTDAQAGRRLGVSTRTVGRMAAVLMDRLGARSRFQAGALANARGWLGPL